MEDKIYEVTEVRTADTLAMRIRTTVRNTQKIMLDAAISIGQDLVEAKELVDHGEWQNWLENSVGFSYESAKKYMQISREYSDFSKRELITDLSYTKALRLLAVPDEDREEFLENNDVKDITVKELEEKIKELNQGKESSDNRAKKLEEDLEKAEKEKASYSQREKALADQLNELKESTPGGITEEAQAEIDRIRTEKLEEIKQIAKEKEAAEAKTDKLKNQIEQLKKDQEQIVAKEKEKAAAEAKAEAKKETEAEIQQLMETADKANKAKIEAEKKLANASNEDLTKCKIRVNQMQEAFNDAMELLAEIQKGEPEQAAKLREVLKFILAKLQEQL